MMMINTVRFVAEKASVEACSKKGINVVSPSDELSNVSLFGDPPKLKKGKK
jgi:hypothetical protein